MSSEKPRNVLALQAGPSLWNTIVAGRRRSSLQGYSKALGKSSQPESIAERPIAANLEGACRGPPNRCAHGRPRYQLSPLFDATIGIQRRFADNRTPVTTYQTCRAPPIP